MIDAIRLSTNDQSTLHSNDYFTLGPLRINLVICLFEDLVSTSMHLVLGTVPLVRLPSSKYYLSAPLIFHLHKVGEYVPDYPFERSRYRIDTFEGCRP